MRSSHPIRHLSGTEVTFKSLQGSLAGPFTTLFPSEGNPGAYGQTLLDASDSTGSPARSADEPRPPATGKPLDPESSDCPHAHAAQLLAAATRIALFAPSQAWFRRDSRGEPRELGEHLTARPGSSWYGPSAVYALQEAAILLANGPANSLSDLLELIFEDGRSVPCAYGRLSNPYGPLSSRGASAGERPSARPFACDQAIAYDAFARSRQTPRGRRSMTACRQVVPGRLVAAAVVVDAPLTKSRQRGARRSFSEEPPGKTLSCRRRASRWPYYAWPLDEELGLRSPEADTRPVEGLVSIFDLLGASRRTASARPIWSPLPNPRTRSISREPAVRPPVLSPREGLDGRRT